MQRIKKGDTVQVISGNEKGTRGQVERVINAKYVDRFNQVLDRDPNKDKVLVRGVNIRKKHQRPMSQTRTQTGIIDKEMPIHSSNVLVVCPNCTEAVRVGFVVDGDGKKKRVCKRCGKNID